ncbi:MAG: ATP-dependent Clp protease ATP-binding subunit [Candidatus Omnitrophota bacterium]
MSEFSIGANLAWQIAASEAAEAKYQCIEKEHIFIGICSLEKVFSVEQIKERLGVEVKNLEAEYHVLEKAIKSLALDMAEMRRAARNALGAGNYERQEKVIHRSPDCKSYFSRGQELGKGGLNVFSLLAAILEKPGEIISGIFKEFNVKPEHLKDKLLGCAADFKEKGKKIVQEVKAAKKEENEFAWLDRFGRNLVKDAKEGKLMPIEGRREEMLQLVRTLSRKTKNNPVLVGEAGVGKTAIVEGLAQRIAEGKNLPGMKIIELSIGSLLAGTSYRGEFEQRIQNVVKEAKEHPEVILFLDEIHNLVGAGKISDSSLDAANILKPALARGEIKCIGATTIVEYRKYIEKDAALERRFQPVRINEPTPEESIRILQRLKPKFEEHHKVSISDAAIIKAVELSVRYLPYRQLPDKAVDIIDEACASVQVPMLSFVKGMETQESKAEKKEISTSLSEEKVAEVVSKLTGIPVGKLTEKDVDRLLNLEKYLNEKIKGQEEAVKIVASKIRLAKTGMRDKNRPLGVFLFLGPTGVGKTLFAKTIADVLFGSQNEMIRLDMSEYKERHEISKLIGSPPGYIGHEEEGQLTGKLRSKPYSVVLLDEVEKAHSEVWDTFLQLFDEGRLTDSKGRTIDAKNAIFVMTSNLPPENKNRMGFKEGASQLEEEDTLSAVRKNFRPEFLNRIDKIVIFRHLGKEHIKDIVNEQLKALQEQIAKEYGISLSFSQTAVDLISEVGYSEQNGAREIHRTIERLIKEPLSEELLRFQGKGVQLKGKTIKVESKEQTIKIIWETSGSRLTQAPEA